MAKILIIPDVHGRDFWKKPCERVDDFDKIIFLGDYHDPYPYQVSQDKSRHQLRDELVPFIEANRDKIVCLYGNHDNYLIDGDCCRHDSYHYKDIKSLLNRMNIQLIYQIDGYLFSHSGVLPDWLDINGLSLEDLSTLKLNHPALEQVSPHRGGWSPIGSCIWGDVREYLNAKKLPDIYQIFGHTQLQKEAITDTFACLDCRKAFVLDTETKELKEFNEQTD